MLGRFVRILSGRQHQPERCESRRRSRSWRSVAGAILVSGLAGCAASRETPVERFTVQEIFARIGDWEGFFQAAKVGKHDHCDFVDVKSQKACCHALLGDIRAHDLELQRLADSGGIDDLAAYMVEYARMVDAYHAYCEDCRQFDELQCP